MFKWNHVSSWYVLDTENDGGYRLYYDPLINRLAIYYLNGIKKDFLGELTIGDEVFELVMEAFNVVASIGES